MARLHSGDPSVFSAVAEQMRRLDAAGVPYEVVPGVPAFAAAAAALRRELTVPGVGADGHADPRPRPGHPDAAGRGPAPRWPPAAATIVLHLAVQRIDEVVAELRRTTAADCPVAVVARASRDDEVILRGTLADIAERVAEADVRRTAVIVVGPVVGPDPGCDSHLYSAARTRP